MSFHDATRGWLQPQHDLGTFSGRFMHYLAITDTRKVMLTQCDLIRSRAVRHWLGFHVLPAPPPIPAAGYCSYVCLWVLETFLFACFPCLQLIAKYERGEVRQSPTAQKRLWEVGLFSHAVLSSILPRAWLTGASTLGGIRHTMCEIPWCMQGLGR